MTLRTAPAQTADRAGERPRPTSPASPSLGREDVHPCPGCGKPALEGYPHHHYVPPRSAYDPLGDRPAAVYCGAFDVNGYWTGQGGAPSCCLTHRVAFEVRAELPEHVHPARYRIPTGTEPIPLHPGAPDGPTVDVSDSGIGWPWSRPAHRLFGGVGRQADGSALNARDYAIFPWAYALEVRLARHCARRHAGDPETWPEHRGRAVCSPIARLVTERGYAPRVIARAIGMPERQLLAILETSLLYAWRSVDHFLSLSA